MKTNKFAHLPIHQLVDKVNLLKAQLVELPTNTSAQADLEQAEAELDRKRKLYQHGR
jgi:hypothetical protein